MTKFLFWNIRNTASESVVADIAASKHADIVALAEAKCVDDIALIAELQNSSRRKYEAVPGAFRIKVYSCLPRTYIKTLSDTVDGVFLSVKQSLGPSLLLSLVHLQSKMGIDPASVDMMATRFRPQIEMMEQSVRHSRTLVMGDFNMDPFDGGLVDSEAFHSTMCRVIAKRGERTVRGASRKLFYNPMWRLLGDRSSTSPPGTFYRNKSESKALFWHMVDQVLIRPEAVDLVNIDSLEIVTNTSNLSLRSDNGLPNRKYSDHFPIFIETYNASAHASGGSGV